MDVLKQIEKIPFQEKQLVVALGNFDGVHCGHQCLIREMTAYARKVGALPAVLLFYPHPQIVLNPTQAPKLLSDAEKKRELMQRLGVEVVFMVPFNMRFASLTPEEFIVEVLLNKLRAAEVFIGYDYRFGRKAAGTPELLKEYGANHGFHVHVIPPVIIQGIPVSSTAIRAALTKGDIHRAKKMLGYWPIVKGKVITGDQRGRKMGYPTANIHVHRDLLVPKNGVYVGQAVLHGKHYLTVLNIGTHPTVGACETEIIEAHLLDFQGDVYNEEIEVSLFQRLRDEQKFASVHVLIDQIRKDIAAAVKLYADFDATTAL